MGVSIANGYGEQSISGRSALSARVFYCAKCSCCVVPALGDLCCFCEDGELCPRQKLKQRERTQQQKVDVQVDQVRAQLEKEIFDLTGALVNLGWKSKRANGVAAKVVADMPEASFDERFRKVMSGNWGEELAPVKQAAPKQDLKEEKMPKKIEFDVDRYQKLAAKGLSQKEIAGEMGIGYSTLSTKTSQLRREGKLSDDAPRPEKRKQVRTKNNGHSADPALATNGHGKVQAMIAQAGADLGLPSGPHRHPMLVTPDFLDRFWAALPLEEKVRILERV